MEIWSASKLKDIISKVKDSGRTGDEQNVMYVLSPFITSLGYDVFNMDEVDMEMMMGRMKIAVTESTRLTVSLSSYFPSETKDKMFLQVNIHEEKLTLSLKALGEWEQVGEVDLNKEDSSGTYPQIMRLIAKESLQRTLEEKGERLFTEGVLRKQLDSGRVDNRFVRDVILGELENPSENFIKLIAEGLVNKYSTDNVSTIVSGLMELKEIGLQDIVTDILQVKRDVISLPVEESTLPVQSEKPKEEFLTEEEPVSGAFIARGEESKLTTYEEEEEKDDTGTFIPVNNGEDGEDTVEDVEEEEEPTLLEPAVTSLDDALGETRIRNFVPKRSREVEEDITSGVNEGKDLETLLNPEGGR